SRPECAMHLKLKCLERFLLHPRDMTSAVSKPTRDVEKRLAVHVDAMDDFSFEAIKPFARLLTQLHKLLPKEKLVGGNTLLPVERLDNIKGIEVISVKLRHAARSTFELLVIEKRNGIRIREGRNCTYEIS